MLKLSSTTVVNSIFWITSLHPKERGTTQRVHDDLLPYLNSIGLPFQAFNPQSAAELLATLDAIAGAASSGTKPIVHFDTHGNAKHGIYVAASGEFVSWVQLIERLRAINIATQNNLCVVSAACFSLHAIQPLKITQPCPFLMLIAPEREVTFGFIEDKTFGFYRDLFAGSNITTAFERHLAPALKIFHSERMLAISLTRYIRSSCIGKDGDRRREDLLTKALSGGIPNNRHNKRMIRKAAKVMTKPTQRLIDEYASTFLIGRKVEYTINDLEALARGALAEKT
jgi:hypothetical protein